MSLFGKLVPRPHLRVIRRELLAGKIQAVGGQRRTTGTAPPMTGASLPMGAAAPPAPVTEQASAHEAVMRFLQVIEIAELPEGKQLLSDAQWIVGDADRGKNFYSRPEYTDVTPIFASLFDTDIPTIKGYKELFDMKTVTHAGTTTNVKFLVVAFKDETTGKWKVLGSLDNLGDESGIDIEHQIAYFKDHLADTRYESARENYASYGHWLLMDGRISDAKTALTFAKTASTERSAMEDRFHNEDDPLRGLQIVVLLTLIDNITPSPKTGP